MAKKRSMRISGPVIKTIAVIAALIIGNQSINQSINHYTFPVRRLGVHLDHLLDNVCPFLLVLAQSPPTDLHLPFCTYL